MTNNQLYNQELEIGKKIANKEISASDASKIRLEIATGNMLGDGSIVTHAKRNDPKGFALKLNSSYKEYIDHLYNIYQEYTTQKIYDKNVGRVGKEGNPLDPCWAFDTRVRKEFFIFKKWRLTEGPRLEELNKRNVKKKRKTIKILSRQS